MQQNTTTKPQRRALFGIRNPILKAIFLLVFVLLTGGLGLIIVLLAYGGDYLRKRKKAGSSIMSICLAALLLAGCATEKVAEGVHLLQGEKLKTAIAYLGYPDSKLEVEGNTIYEWSYNHTSTGVQAISKPYYGTVYGAGGSASYSGQSTSYVPQTHRHHCTIRLMTDKRSTIIGSAWRGNESGCSDYADALEKLIEERKAGGAQ